jgi:hypothetical protein
MDGIGQGFDDLRGHALAALAKREDIDLEQRCSGCAPLVICEDFAI